jgi:ABC-2 type transport system permease protein
MIGPKRIAVFAVPTLVPLAYFAAVAFALSRSTIQMYGFPVSPDLRTAIEIALQACPMVAALFMMLTSSFREDLIKRLALLFLPANHRAYTIVMLTVNVFLAALITALTAAAILSVCGWQRDAVHPRTLVWVAFEFTVDITLIGIFTVFLHALTRRVWATFLQFAAYAALVVIFGTKWGITSFIGFASTVPVRLTSYSGMPLYDTAGWLFRFYWIAVAGVLVAILHRFSRSPEPLAVTLYKQWSAQETKRWKYRIAIACVGPLAIALCLFQIQQYALSRYRGLSPRRLDGMLSQVPGDTRLRITDYDLQLAYQPDQQSVHVLGRLTLENEKGSMRVAYLQLPSVMTPDHIELEGAGLYQLTNLGEYVRIELAAPVLSNQQVELRYSGIIHPVGPFDLTLQAKLLKEAFFFTDSDILVAPRRPSCLISNPSLQAKRAIPCETENYTMSDMATGTIRVTAPVGFIAVGPGDRMLESEGQSMFRVATPQMTTFMVACARFVETSVASTDGLPAVHVYRAAIDGSAQALIGRAILSFYQKYWPAYRLAELRIVETPTPLGEAVAFDGVLAIGDRIVRSRDPISGETSNLAEFVLAHEIAHQWWGYQVIPSKAPGRLFVLESFAQFAAYKYLEDRGIMREDAAIQSEKNRYQLARAHRAKSEVPLPFLEQDLEFAYHKGPFVLLSLDKMSGDSLMDRFGDLIGLYTQNDGSPARPQPIVETLIDRLPAISRERARSLLFATTAQFQSEAESAKSTGSQPPQN